MQLPRRKTAFPLESVSMKARKNNNLLIFVVVFSIFLFGIFMYNEDVKSIAEFPFSTPKAQELQEDESKQSNPVQETKENPLFKRPNRVTLFNKPNRAKSITGFHETE
ncbi:protein ESKIMO 1-like [Prunus yedoensis var. nudiflora]|uniref:Protein ESKIMO 1-like n=1 Tax=Prunus yedoensis var. nudiflora TaxID=2094558 RepID=A0A314XYP0_PRUYE|nr:protein ESKIMO 1-like [Prunus yedoensis var. nudiflora]